MLLRRVIGHVKAQNWTAVALDFVIVVVGVFIGIQVSNWNDGRGDAAEYQRALQRLNHEIEANVQALDVFDPEIAEALSTVDSAMTALQSCEDTKANRDLIDEGLAIVRSTRGLRLRTNALDEITSNPRLLARQSPGARQAFAELLFYTDVVIQDARTSETAPTRERVENNPLLGVGAPTRHSYSAGIPGMDFYEVQRALVLDASVMEACEDDRLIKAFFTWERFQNDLPALSQRLRAEYERTKAILSGEMR